MLPADSITLGVKSVEKDGEVVSEEIAVFHTACWQEFAPAHDLPAG